MSTESASCFYTVLGVNPSASEDAIRKAYKKRVLQWHPDKNLNNPDAESLFKMLQKAYETLSDRQAKEEYDAKSDADNSPPQKDLLQLSFDNCLSNIYKDKLDQWMKEYSSIHFVDNYNEEINAIILSMLEKYQEDVQNPIEQCLVCHELIENKDEHMKMRSKDYLSHLEEYAQDFNTTMRNLSPKGWNWRPIPLASSSMSQKLLGNTKWEHFQEIIAKMSIVQETFASTDNSEEIFYRLLQKIDPQIERMVADLALVNIPLSSPDVTYLRQLIDSENKTYPSGTDRGEKHREYGHICLIRDDTHPILKHLYYDVPQPLSSARTSIKSNYCSNCQVKFHLFNKKESCRMCSKQICKKCILWQTCRHLGYVMPVIICQSCVEKKKTTIIDTIVHRIDKQMTLKRYEYISEYLALLKTYSFHNDVFYKSILKRLLASQQYTVAMQHAEHIDQSEDEWLSLTETMVHKNAYHETATCFQMISRRFSLGDQYWISLGDKYRREGIHISMEWKSIKLAILAYRQAGLSFDGILRKAAGELNAHARCLIVRYVAHANKQASDQWKADGILRVIQQHRRSVGICCLHLAQLSISEWAETLQYLIDSSEYNSAAILLLTLNSKVVKEIMTYANPAVRFFCEERNKTGLSLVHRLESFLKSENINDIPVIAALVHVQKTDSIWYTLEQQYLSGKKECNKAMICHQIQSKLNLSVSSDWIDQGILDCCSMAFEFKDVENCNWLNIGDKYVQIRNYEIALQCYCRAARGTAANHAAIHKHILFLISELPIDIALWYGVVVYKQAQDMSHLICDAAWHITKVLTMNGNRSKQFVISALHLLNKSNQLVCSSLTAMNAHLLASLAVSSKEYVSGLHLLQTVSSSESTFITVKQQYEEYIYDQDYKIIQHAMSLSIIELAVFLKQRTSPKALQNFVNDFRSHSSILQLPKLILAKLDLIQAMIYKLKSRYNEFFQSMHQILTHVWHDDIPIALAMFLQDPMLMKKGKQLISSKLVHLPNGDLTELSCLIAPIVSTPKITRYQNYLKDDPMLKLISKYENGILKEMNADRFKSAMAYIDLCMAVSNRTCVASNWILACLHLYGDLLNMFACFESLPRAYAYRNLINELAIHAFLLAREHLAPYVQIYIYKLVLTLLVHTNRHFSELLKSCPNSSSNGSIENTFSSRSTVITKQILTRLIDFTTFVPVISVPVLLTHDLLCYELVGFDCLYAYLKVMIQDNTSNSRYFYDYYLLEGVWDRWIRNENFELIRQQSMKSLLAKKNWTVLHVERILNDRLIPRTSDGWLLNERAPLNLSGPKLYNKVDGISFNYKTGEVKFLFVPHQYPGPMALFDSDDITDVFTKGLTNTIISLNQPDQTFLSHPFQEIKYLPQSLANTKYLTTLLHTDYLLKFITTGMEINSKWPFPMRLGSEGFMQRLPQRLQELLKPLQMREKFLSRGNIHRFWIEAGDPIYECSVDETTTEIIYRLDDVPMHVKQHLMKYDDEGELIDHKQLDNEPDFSREAQFVKAFTDNYNEIGAYFPEFLRLKELAKLGVLLNFMRHRYKSLKVNIDKDEDVQKLCKNLCDARQGFKYPSENTDNIESIYKKILRDDNISSDDVSDNEEKDVQNIIRSWFEEDDREIVKKIAEWVCKFCYSAEETLVQRLVDRWLYQSSATDPRLWSCQDSAAIELVSFIRTAITNHKQLLMNAIEKLNVSLETNHAIDLTNDNRICSWVPAVFMNQSIGQSRVYGGVCLFPNVHPGYIRPNPQTYSFSADTELNVTNVEIPQTYQYESDRREEEEKERMENSPPRWITVYLQSNPDTMNLFEFGVESNKDENETHTFDNVDSCLDYLSTVNNDYVLIVVSDKYANDKQTLIKLQESLPVSVVYRKLPDNNQQPLYTDKELKDICPKLQGSFTSTNPVSYPLTNSSNETFNVFSSDNTHYSTRNLTEESVTFLWYQVMIDLILSSPLTLQMKEDFFAECRRLSKRDAPRLIEIARIQKIYDANDTLSYYVTSCWFCELINKALRLQKIPNIYRLRLGIIDLNNQMMKMKSESTRKITLYRGQKMRMNEMAKISGNINGLLSFNSFLSTSRSKEVAMVFADSENQRQNTDDQLSVVFEMNIHKNQFSDIMNISRYPHEQECLFFIGTIFKIRSVDKVQSDGKDYYHVQLIDVKQSDLEQLNRVKEQFQKRVAINNGPFRLQWGRLLYHVGYYDAAARHYKYWLKHFGDTDDQELLATIHNDIGLIYFEKRQYKLSNKHHSRAWAQAQTAPFRLGLSGFYNNQGGTQMGLKAYSKALDMYRRALNLEERCLPKNTLTIGRLYSNMGLVHVHLRQFRMGLGCFQAAFKLQQRISLSHAMDLATTCHHLGDAYTNINDYAQAEKFYGEAYGLANRSLPERHRTLRLFETKWKTSQNKLADMKQNVTSKNNIGTAYPTGRRNSDISVAHITIE